MHNRPEVSGVSEMQLRDSRRFTEGINKDWHVFTMAFGRSIGMHGVRASCRMAFLWSGLDYLAHD